MNMEYLEAENTVSVLWIEEVWNSQKQIQGSHEIYPWKTTSMIQMCVEWLAWTAQSLLQNVLCHISDLTQWLSPRISGTLVSLSCSTRLRVYVLPWWEFPHIPMHSCYLRQKKLSDLHLDSLRSFSQIVVTELPIYLRTMLKPLFVVQLNSPSPPLLQRFLPSIFGIYNASAKSPQLTKTIWDPPSVYASRRSA